MLNQQSYFHSKVKIISHYETVTALEVAELLVGTINKENN